MSQDITPPITRSTLYWYADGNIVLQVEYTQFRLHQSLLGKHFPIFADALNFRGAREIADVDQCPVVKVEGDKVEDWENVLMAVFDPYLLYTNPSDYPIPVILSTLRLSVKYEANHLRDMAANCLRKLLPTEFTEWINTGIANQHDVSDPPAFVDHIFEIIDILVETGLKSILPVAYLVCLLFRSMPEILHGHTRKDSTISSLSLSSSKTLVLGSRTMSKDAMRTIVIHAMLIPVPANCAKRHYLQFSENDGQWLDCDDAERTECFAEWIISLTDNPAHAFMSMNPPIGMCDVCAGGLKVEVEEGRRELWDRLPIFFGLPPWDRLKDFDS